MKPAPKTLALAAKRGALRDRDRELLDPAVVLRVRRLLGQLEGDGRALVDLKTALAERRDDIERAVVAWVELVEVLVQDAERRYPGPGMGAAKAAEVKAAIRCLLRSRRIGLPAVPRALQPLLADVVASWSVDAVVALLDRHGMWSESDPGPVRAALAWLRRLAWAVLRPVLAAAAWLADRVWSLLAFRDALSPAVQAAIRAVEEDGVLGRTAASGAMEVVAEIGRHRDAIIAGVQLVGIAVEETERFASLDGPDKREYATELILAVLGDLGVPVDSPVVSLLVELVAGALIEAMVRLFRKRGRFTPGGSASAAPSARAGTGTPLRSPR